MLEQEFRKWLNSTDTEILVCWDLGHIWDVSLYSHIEKVAHGAYLLHGVCQRGCGVERARYLTSAWTPDPGRNTYKYPRLYSPRGMIREGFFMDREHRAAIRRELARRYAEDKRKIVPLRGA